MLQSGLLDCFEASSYLATRVHFESRLYECQLNRNAIPTYPAELLEGHTTLSGGLNKSLQSWILQLPNVIEAPHKFGGAAFSIQNLEFMHSHGESQLDIRLSKEDQGRMLKLGKAEPHVFTHAQSGWVVFRIRSENDLDSAKELIRLAYDNAEKLMRSHESRRSDTEPGA